MLDAERRYEIRLARLKRWIWIYFWLLVFEGVLRKWVYPSASGPLLLIRDPVAMIIYYHAYRCRKLTMRTMWPFAFLAAALLLLGCIQVAYSITTLPIVLFGLRSYLLHPPLIFVIAMALDNEDMLKFGRWLLILSVPMLALVLAQFNSSASAWLNAGAWEGSSQIAAAGNHIRPAGTFTYGVGMQCLVILTSAFLLDALMYRRKYPPLIVGSALLAVIATVPLLGSRTVLFNLLALTVFTLLSGLSHGARLVGLTKTLCLLLLGGLLAMQFSFFNQALETMKLRWEQAARAEGAFQQVLNKRVWGTIAAGGDVATVVPLLGKGIGIGSKFAAAATTGDTRTWLAGEGEWERIVVEFGPIFAFLFLVARIGLAGYMTLQAFSALRRNSVLAWLLLPVALPLVLVTYMEQATCLGFMVFGCGMCLAAARSLQPSPTYMILEPSTA